jgi:hypothetical protein
MRRITIKEGSMSEKHTPGPWTALEHSWSDTGIVAGDEYICLLQIRNSSEEDEEARSEQMAANADLIAAAPDLLSVAEDAFTLICLLQEKGIDVAFDQSDGGTLTSMGSVKAALAAAIDKATGT